METTSSKFSVRIKFRDSDSEFLTLATFGTDEQAEMFASFLHKYCVNFSIGVYGLDDDCKILFF